MTFWKIDDIEVIKFEDKRIVLEIDKLIRYISLIGLRQTIKDNLTKKLTEIYENKKQNLKLQ